ncbi:uncharacterized protein LOC123707923 [Pieris brassicae]|uniref:uncharacterized protein LOC123707923 n=1 Tax=Pieris brassicae TaxID=7116 RepID=UPI001E65F0F9|nr:uncharacterized protein LOC123707923 [Pieris brassicae]
MGKQRQLKIPNLIRKQGVSVSDDCTEIQQRIKTLNEKLCGLQTQLFQIKRNSYKQTILPSKSLAANVVFSRPKNIVLTNSVGVMNRKLELLTVLTGLEVQSYSKNDHCCIVFHMQHDSYNVVKHGLRIEMKSGGNEVTDSSLPVGFNLNEIIDDYDSILKPEYLLSVHKALIAYYDRLQQYESLERLLSINGTLFKALDGSHIEVTFYMHSDDDNLDVKVILILDYRVHDIRPKTYVIKTDLPEEILETLQHHCLLFKKKPLKNAFRLIFMDDGPWQLVNQMGIHKEHTAIRPKRFRPNRNPNNDDTFRPEECSDQGEDEEYVE